MKKIISVVLSLLLLAVLVAPVAADGSATMRLSVSSGTLRRGDTFTITVILDNDQEISSGSIVLSYNSDALEFVGGSCNVSGITQAEVSAGRNGGLFVLAENRVVSGTIFTIQMKIKSDAKAGKYSISGTAGMDIPCYVSGTFVTVACDHTYGAYQNLGDNHSRVCSACGHEDVSGHNWDSGEVTVSPGCTTDGEKLYTCADCGGTKTEIIEADGSHRFTSWTLSNEYTHYGTCSECNETLFYNHDWEFKEVSRAATCAEKGIETWICYACDGEKTEEIPLNDHQYGEYSSVDEQNHQMGCVNCDHVEVLAHVFSGPYSENADGHWQYCEHCGYAQAPQAHVPGSEATEATSQDCLVCGRLLKVALNHIHIYLPDWVSDEQEHWRNCNFCEHRGQQGSHVYANDCDDSCDVCGYVRVPLHNYSGVLNGDATGHYYPCLGCGDQKDRASHVPGPAATVNAAQTCTACGWEIAPKVTHQHDYTGTPAGHYHTCACGETYPVADGANCGFCQEEPVRENGRFPWWILCIAEGVLLILALILLLLPKRQQKGKYYEGHYSGK